MGLTNTVGALFVGASIAIMFYGFTNFLTYLYFAHYPNDRIVMKLMVSATWFLDTAHVVLLTHSLYFYLIENFHNLPALQNATWSLSSSILISIVLSTASKFYFVYRVYCLYNTRLRWWLAGLCCLHVTAHAGFGTYVVVKLFLDPRLSRFGHRLFIEIVPFLGCSLLADVLISGALTKSLSNAGFGRKKPPTNTSLLYAFSRLGLVAIIDLANLIVFCVLPGTLWFMAFNAISAKMHTTSLLAALDVRYCANGRGINEEDVKEIKPPAIRWRRSLINAMNASLASPGQPVEVHRPISIGSSHSTYSTDDTYGDVLDIGSDKSAPMSPVVSPIDVDTGVLYYLNMEAAKWEEEQARRHPLPSLYTITEEDGTVRSIRTAVSLKSSRSFRSNVQR